MQIVNQSGTRTPVDLSRLEVIVAAGSALRVRAWPAHAELAPTPGPYQLELEGEAVLPCTIEAIGVESSTAWVLRRTPIMDSQPPAEGVTLFQRGETESVADLLTRWVSPGEISPPDAKVGPPARLETVFRPGIVLLQHGGGDLAYRLRLVHGLCAERSSSFAGLYESPQTGWSFFGHEPGTTEINHVCELRPVAWRIHSDNVANWTPEWRDDRRVHRGLHLEPAERKRWLKDISSGSARLLSEDDGEKDAVPLRPMTVRWGKEGPYLFGQRIRIVFSFLDTRDPINTGFELALGVCRHPGDTVARSGTSRLLLGRFKQWAGADRPHLLLVEPLADNESPLSGRFPPWKLGKGSAEAGLIAVMLAPGYVRPGYSAFFARMKADDVVVIEVRDGELPLVLGSVQQFRDYPDQELRLSATAVGMVVVDPEGKETGTFTALSRDEIQLEAAKKLAAMEETLVVSTGDLKIGVNTSIDGELKVS